MWSHPSTTLVVGHVPPLPVAPAPGPHGGALAAGGIAHFAPRPTPRHCCRGQGAQPTTLHFPVDAPPRAQQEPAELGGAQSSLPCATLGTSSQRKARWCWGLLGRVIPTYPHSSLPSMARPEVVLGHVAPETLSAPLLLSQQAANIQAVTNMTGEKAQEAQVTHPICVT